MLIKIPWILLTDKLNKKQKIFSAPYSVVCKINRYYLLVFIHHWFLTQRHGEPFNFLRASIARQAQEPSSAFCLLHNKASTFGSGIGLSHLSLSEL
jgi:hypothetical protein